MEQPFVETARGSLIVAAHRIRALPGRRKASGGPAGVSSFARFWRAARAAALFGFAPPDRLGVRDLDLAPAQRGENRRALRPCRSPAARPAWAAALSASVPAASAFSSSSSSRSSMSKRMARPRHDRESRRRAGTQRCHAAIDGEGGEAGRWRRRRRVLFGPHAPQQGQQRRGIGSQQLGQIDRAPPEPDAEGAQARGSAGRRLSGSDSAGAVQASRNSPPADGRCRAPGRAGHRRCRLLASAASRSASSGCKPCGDARRHPVSQARLQRSCALFSMLIRQHLR